VGGGARAAPGQARHAALPAAAVDRLLAPLLRFLHVEAASGVVLLLATAAALGAANSPLADRFLAF